ncbi:exonuclease V [Lacerta agilis]|uniref:exonuclease V n=1 Tax=Lacerta agilis TaxID=80427 RepID=UPI00141979C5|nr:exonuclease V [Lacerta agilis]
MSGRDSGLEEAETASGFSDLSDSEFLQIEEPEAGDSEKPSSSLGPPAESEGGDVAKGSVLETGKRKRSHVPLEIFHLRYLSVTDISAQVWCEQQMVYRRELPDLTPPENIVLLNTGKSIHLARELEDHDLVTVSTTSREDSWAIKVLNLLVMLSVLQAGHRVREFPVFGVLEDIFVVGVIDQLGYTPKGELELNELKTRNNASMPSAAQKKRDRFQVFLYKYLFDAMVRGCLAPDSFLQRLHLRPEQPLGPQVQEQARKSGFTVSCFCDLLELLSLNLTHCDIPAIDRLQIEYVHQDSGAALGTEVLAYDQDEVGAAVRYFLAYWKGQRDSRGVDVEDAWKCRYCAYSGICEWRMGKAGSPAEQWKKSK